MSEESQPGAIPGKHAPVGEKNSGTAAKLSRKRKWLLRIAAILIGPLLVFGSLELCLRAGGYGYSTSFFVDGVPVEQEPVWIDNCNFGLWIFPHKYEGRPQPVPFVLPKEKPENTYRIFVLGESAAMGFPDPSISFSRVLEVMLRTAFPKKRFEVINCSMVAINSHGVLQIARQCADFQPDLFIVHLGNNEVVGPFGATGVLGPFSPDVRVVRTNLAIKRSRCGQLIDDLFQRLARRGSEKQKWNGMSMLLENKVRHDDERLAKVYANFRANLEDIIAAGRDAGAQVVLCTVPVNLRNCAPFSSQHAPGLGSEQLQHWESIFAEGTQLQEKKEFAKALERYHEAESVDDGFAELAYRSGQCALALGDKIAAQAAFTRARDLDALRFRTDSTITGITREVAAAHQAAEVRLADAVKRFAESDPMGLPGEEFFLEHVHMTFKGNYLLAKEIFSTLTNPVLTGLGSPEANSSTVLSEPSASEQLAHTGWSEWKHGQNVYQGLIQSPPFTFQFDHAEDCRRREERLKSLEEHLNSGGKNLARQVYEKALKINKGDWMIHSQFGAFLLDEGEIEEAERQLRDAVAHCHHLSDVQCLLGEVEMTRNRLSDAEKRFRDVIRFNPNEDSAHLDLADVLSMEGKTSEAMEYLERQLRERPKNLAILKMMGNILLRSGRYDEAKAKIDAALAINPKEPDLYTFLGMISMKQQNFADAVEQFQMALKIKPDSPEVAKLLREAEQERK